MAEQITRFAAIDIGTVTCRLLVADVIDGSLFELKRAMRITNLGDGVDKTGILSEAALDRVVGAMRFFLSILKDYEDLDHPSIPISAIATSAARDATNSDVLVEKLSELGIHLAIIPGEREAALSFAGATRNYFEQPVIVVDVGGGSTEVICGVGGVNIAYRHSFQIGCRRITERYLHADPPTQEELACARSALDEALKPILDEFRAFKTNTLLAVAGTATTCVSVTKHMETYDPACVDGERITLDQLEKLLHQMATTPLELRKTIVGLEPGRAPVIVAGLLILERILTLLGQSGFIASESDILQGLIMNAA